MPTLRETDIESPAEQIEALPVRIAVAVACELLNLASYVFRVPMFFCFLGLAGMAVMTLQEAYPRAFRVVFPVLAFLPDEIHLDTAAFLKVYAAFSLGWYVLTRPIRLMLGDRIPLTYKSRFASVAAIATIGWGFELWSLQYMRIAADSSRLGLAITFLGFYGITLAALGVGVVLDKCADLIVDAGNDYSRRVRTSNGTQRNGEHFVVVSCPSPEQWHVIWGIAVVFSLPAIFAAANGQPLELLIMVLVGAALLVWKLRCSEERE